MANVLDFPSDLYTLASQVRLRGLDPAEHLTLVASRDGRTILEDDLIAALDERTALLVIPSVLYRSGQLLDIARLTAAAHERGVLVGVDASHSAGAVPHELHAWGVDWAVWCSYKYLNGGPGAVAALYVHERHHGIVPALAGWWGSDKSRQFDMATEFTPAEHAGAWQIGTPSIFGAAALYGALGITQAAGIERIRAKSLAQTDWLMRLADAYLTEPPYSFTVGTPREAERRGGHVALEHAEAVQICKALKARGFVPDFRQPNVIRLGAHRPVHHLRRTVADRPGAQGDRVERGAPAVRGRPRDGRLAALCRTATWMSACQARWLPVFFSPSRMRPASRIKRWIASARAGSSVSWKCSSTPGMMVCRRHTDSTGS